MMEHRVTWIFAGVYWEDPGDNEHYTTLAVEILIADVTLKRLWTWKWSAN